MTAATLITLQDLIAARAPWQERGESLAFVPTMGALHAGHLSLVRLAKVSADRVLVSIFVNPTQFGPNEDFERYPRTVAADLELLRQEGVDAVFLPNVSTLYPDGFQTTVRNRDLENQLCGAFRPGHFEGVLSVVLKLFNMVRPDCAVFGKKDYQQWRMIETMVRDLNIDVKIIGAETIRESDGLALSSRNRYLDAETRGGSAAIFQGLDAAAILYAKGEREQKKLVSACTDAILSVSGAAVEYVEIRRQFDLGKLENGSDEPAVMLVAARFGAVRLIDNLEFKSP
jgi:pantoate--beta-alanine ligase